MDTGSHNAVNNLTEHTQSIKDLLVSSYSAPINLSAIVYTADVKISNNYKQI